jgi:3-hydroxyisobutyrate dehydrogenase-like beta-hydroxyacid dehydrogenase
MIAHLGTGLLGAAMVENALAGGEAVTVWNRTAAKAERLAAKGARVAATPDEAVRGAERVHVVLSEDAAVDAVLPRIVPHVAKGAVVIDHTTCAPDGVRARYDAMERAGVLFLHAPVFMSPGMAREAKGTILASGPRDRFARVEPALAKMTGLVWHVGERVDLAAAYKLCGNAMLVAIAGGIADVFAMGRGVGLEPREALAVFEKFDPRVFPRGQRMAEGDFTPSFELAMARKDVRLALDMAEKSGLPLAVLPAIARRFDELIAAGHGADDYGIIAADAVRGKEV